jgi:predicted nucleotidyltransferase component of viral defense system
MVYVRKIKIHGNVYYELVKCQRDKNKNPRQEHLAYLGKNLISKKEIKLFEKNFKSYDRKERSVSLIIHSLMKGGDGFLDLEKLYFKCLNQGISKKIVDNFIKEHLNQSKFVRVEVSESNFKTNLASQILEKIRKVANLRNFQERDLEKVVRLNLILKEIYDDNFLKNKLVFFGGTAINGIYKNYPRLSVDIDLQYLKPEDKNLINRDKKKIKGRIREILKEKGYNFKEREYELDQFLIKYEYKKGRYDMIKLEINYLDSTTILPTIRAKVKSPIDGSSTKVITMQKEELYARKLSALLDRSTCRDLYDMSRVEDYNKEVLRKCLLVNFLIRNKNIDKFLNSIIKQPSKEEFEAYLRPLIDQKENIDLKELNLKSETLVMDLKESITKGEFEFCKNFDNKNPKFENLFENIEINKDINSSFLLKKKVEK